MTVVVAFVGTDGAVMASDSEATESSHTRYDVEKIWTCGGLLMGYTGTSSVKQPLVASFDTAIKNKFGHSEVIDRLEALQVLRQCCFEELQGCYNTHLGARDGFGIPIALMGIVLILGRDANGYWLLEIDQMAQATFYTEQGFHGVGSGAPAAYVSHSLMRDYESDGRSVADLKLIAHRTVQTCIDTIGGALGVGGEVQLWYSQDGQPFAKASQQDAQATAMGVEQWRSVERESLDKVVLGGRPAPQGVPLPELPEGLQQSTAPKPSPGESEPGQSV